MIISNIRKVVFGIIQGIVGLIVGAVGSVSAIWAGGLYFPAGMPLVMALVCGVTAGVATWLWRRGGRTGAVCLGAGALVGPVAVFGFLAYSASIGEPM